MRSCYNLILAVPQGYSANSQFGDGNQGFAYAITKCFGWEKSISQCIRQEIDCPRSQAPGVTCRDGITICIMTMDASRL